MKADKFSRIYVDSTVQAFVAGHVQWLRTSAYHLQDSTFGWGITCQHWRQNSPSSWNTAANLDLQFTQLNWSSSSTCFFKEFADPVKGANFKLDGIPSSSDIYSSIWQSISAVMDMCMSMFITPNTAQPMWDYRSAYDQKSDRAFRNIIWTKTSCNSVWPPAE